MSVVARQPKAGLRAPRADGGYEESHGYGPSHGGPTGPGDAPSIGEGGSGPALARPRSSRAVSPPKDDRRRRSRR
jgi:hypothetical protein